jgi:hypothetical protein
MLACLRFADLVTETVARLATGSGGLTLGRAGFPPAGQRTKFHGVIAIPPIPIDQHCLVASMHQRPDKAVDLPCTGVFEMENGKIKVWRDYFDLTTYIKGMS